MSIALHSRTDLRPRSGLGISSFALGAISTLSSMLLTGYASVFNKTGSANAMIGEGMVLVWIINLIGIGLGIAGVVPRSSRKTFPILDPDRTFDRLDVRRKLPTLKLRA